MTPPIDPSIGARPGDTPEETPDLLLDSVLAGEPHDETRVLFDRMGLSPRVVAMARMALRGGMPAESRPGRPVEDVIDEVRARIADGNTGTRRRRLVGELWRGNGAGRTQTLRSGTNPLRRIIRAIPVIGAVLACAIWTAWLSRSTEHRRPTVSAKAILYETAVAQQATIQLADGTRVRLAPSSRLRVEPSFGAETRTVFLTGEAYFDVGTTSNVPFIVRTAVAETRVLGTSFGVRYDTAHPVTQVTVTSGKVLITTVMSSRARMTLHAGTIGYITDSTVSWSTIDSVSHYVGWTGERLIFRKASMTEVLGVLSRWYGYQFRVDDSTLASQNLTVMLDARSLPNALGTIKLLVPVELVFDGNVVTVRARHARRASPSSRHGGGDALSSSHSEVGR